ncbi:haloacid dehalogenase [Actinoplanes italicus]|uniref:Putative hydrolase of the HAD superfamily n=1 Tax=Actinoplanes italicus TaxID=113567 RepID=A0A2T0JQU2_9ACTN|nr:HAD family hydrolase [Actinoplanes italicus]PRX09796.1 putative hydrolase of the HAD superfamily [Actinoplanes italicus]GIE36232.1 haloacid dehalogenase [Actinoplanes italicus]
MRFHTETLDAGSMDLIEKPPLAVVIDLDDTLFPQSSHLYGAARAVGRAGAAAGLDQVRLSRAVRRQLISGSDRGRTIDRALIAYGIAPDLAADLIPVLVAAFTTYRPRRLPRYPGALDALTAISARYPVACLTDGNPTIQRAKLAATGLSEAFTTIVITDELGGRTLRKPHPEGLRQAAETLGVHPTGLVVIGDRPGKDMAVAAALGARSIRVRTGEYADAPDEPAATATVPDLQAAATLLGA